LRCGTTIGGRSFAPTHSGPKVPAWVASAGSVESSNAKTDAMLAGSTTSMRVRNGIKSEFVIGSIDMRVQNGERVSFVRTDAVEYAPTALGVTVEVADRVATRVTSVFPPAFTADA